jgi:hypothetical protein
MTMGIESSTGKTPLPTSTTTRHVVVEELCTKLVERIPMNRATNGCEQE